jgi:hypothetical protein
MLLAGAGIIAIWNDITAAGRDNFYRWHEQQHIPERVSIEGFLRGRRYIAQSGAPEFYTLYEVRDRAVLSGAAYLERLNHPTDWTTRSVQHFRNTSRSLCDVLFSAGGGSGGIIGTIRFDCAPADDAAVLARLTQDILPKLLEATGIVAAHVCRADLEASTVTTAEQKGRAANLVPRWVVMVEGSLLEPVEAALAGPLGPNALAGAGIAEALHGIYRLEFDLLKAGGANSAA